MNAVLDPRSAIVPEAPAIFGIPLGGYDLVIEISEVTLNRLLGAYHYMGRFPRLKGKYVLPIKDSPEDLLEFITILYEVNFGIPKVDFQEDCVRVIFQPSTQLTVLGELSFAIGIDLTLDIFPEFDAKRQKVFLSFQNPTLDLKINDAPVSRKVADKLNEILRIVFCQYFVDKVPPIDVSPFIRYTYRLPGVQPRLSLNVKEFFLNDKVIGITSNFLDYAGGNLNGVRDFTQGSDIALGLNASGLQRVFGFWWQNSNIKKEVKDSGTITHLNLKDFNLTLDLLNVALAVIFPGVGTAISAIASLWNDPKRLDARYSYSIEIEEPILSPRTGNKIDLTIKAKAHFRMELVLIYKTVSIHRFKIKKVEKSKQLARWTDDADLCVKGSAQLRVDESNRLMADIGDCDIRINIGDLHPLFDALISNLADKFLDKIVGHLSPLQLFAMPVDYSIPNTKVTIPLSASLSTTKKGVFFYLAAGRPEGLEAYSPPPYIANKSKDHMEVHKAECAYVKWIAPRNRVGYYWLDYAYEDKFDNCAFCLGDSKN